MPYRQRIGAFGDFARLAAVRAAGIKQDVVLATSTPLSVAVPGVWSKRRNRVPMVFEVRDLWPAAPIAVGALRSPPMRYAAWALEAWAYRNAAHVIALSPGMAEDIRHRFPGVATTVVPNGCDVGTFGDADGLAVRQAHRWLGDRPMILYAGTLGHVNNARYLVRLAASLSATRPDVCVVIIGDGVEARLVRQYAKDNQVLDRNLFMLAAMPKMEVAGWFAAADLGCAIFIDEPSLNPSSPNKVFDTWAAGKPAAVNNEGWIADILRGTGAGLALPPADPVAAGQQIVSFLDDADRVTEAALFALVTYAWVDPGARAEVDIDRTVGAKPPRQHEPEGREDVRIRRAGVGAHSAPSVQRQHRQAEGPPLGSSGHHSCRLFRLHPDGAR